MRVNEYKSFEEFFEEYNYDRDIEKEHYIGLEFEFHGEYYRLGHDYSSEDAYEFKYWTYELSSNESGEKIYLTSEWKNIGQYKDLNDALDNWIIDGKKFREVIMLDETKILAKD